MEERRYNQEATVGELALSVVNWLEMDKHRVFQAAGDPMPEIELNHPVHKLAAAMRRVDPGLTETASEILKCFRMYGDTTRVLIPHATTKEETDGYADKMAAAANRLTELLAETLEVVLPSNPEK